MMRRADIGAVASLSRREVEYGLPWSWTPARLRKYLAMDSTNAYIAEHKGSVCGFSIASLGDVRAHLILLAVEKHYRRHGLGTMLLQWQLLAAQTAGLTDMSLEVRRSNIAAQRFYESAGFVCKRLLPGYYCGTEDAIRLRVSPVRASITRSNDSTQA